MDFARVVSALEALELTSIQMLSGNFGGSKCSRISSEGFNFSFILLRSSPFSSISATSLYHLSSLLEMSHMGLLFPPITSRSTSSSESSSVKGDSSFMSRFSKSPIAEFESSSDSSLELA